MCVCVCVYVHVCMRVCVHACVYASVSVVWRYVQLVALKILCNDQIHAGQVFTYMLEQVNYYTYMPSFAHKVL